MGRGGTVWIAACAATLLSWVAFAADKRTVVDLAGRRVEVPVKIERVFVAGGPASVFIYTLVPDKLLGWNRPPTPEERAYIPASIRGASGARAAHGRGATDGQC